MNVVTLSRICSYDGSQVICGVFENMDAVLERLRLTAEHMDSGDEYRIEMFTVKSHLNQKKETAECLKSRAEYKKRQQQQQQATEVA
jgi:hypothetical protein